MTQASIQYCPYCQLDIFLSLRRDKRREWYLDPKNPLKASSDEWLASEVAGGGEALHRPLRNRLPKDEASEFRG